MAILRRRDFVTKSTLAIGGLIGTGFLGACQRDNAIALFGKSISGISAETIDGKTINFAELHRLVLIRFSGLWCEPCLRDEDNWIQTITEIRKERDDVNIIEIHSGDVPAGYGTLQEWMNKRPKVAQIPVIYDKDKKITDTLGIPGFPCIIIANRDGKIIDQYWELKTTRNANIFAHKVLEFDVRK